jgi:cyanophycin synthetase
MINQKKIVTVKPISTFLGPNPYALEKACVFELIFSEVFASKSGAILELAQQYFPNYFSTDVEKTTPSLQLLKFALNWTTREVNLRSSFPCGFEMEQTATNRVECRVTNVQLELYMTGLQVIFEAMDSFDADLYLPDNIQARIAQFRQLCSRLLPDYQARILMRAARAADIPFFPVSEMSRLWQYGMGARSRIFFESSSNEDGFIATTVCRDKVQAMAFFRALAVPSVNQIVIRKNIELEQVEAKIGWPCVTKPLNLSGGKGVTTRISSKQELLAGFEHARKASSGPVIVEQFIAGSDFRIMVIDGKVTSVIRREPPFVEGDGLTSVKKLIDELNESRSAGLHQNGYFRPVKIDDAVRLQLKRNGVDFDSVLDSGKKLVLRSNSNLSTGGYCVDETDIIHPQTKRMSEQIAQSLGFQTAGLDYISKDISKSSEETGGAFIEINATPGLDAMINAGQDAIAVGLGVLGKIPARIPVFLVLALPEDMSTLERYLSSSQVLASGGWVCGGKAYAGDVPLYSPGKSVGRLVRSLCLNKTVESIVVVCEQRDITQHGLPLDKFNKAFLLHKTLPEPWLDVIEQCSDQVLQVGSATELVQRLSEAIQG